MSHTARTKRQLALPAVLLIAGAAITFTPTLHENSFANHLLAGGTLLAVAVALFVDQQQVAAGWARLTGLVSAAVCGMGGVALLLQLQGGLPLASNLAIASLVLALVQVAAMVRAGRGHIFPSLYLTLLLAGLAVCELLAGSDQVAAIGWLGAACVVAGVFRAIEVADGLRAGEKATSR